MKTVQMTLDEELVKEVDQVVKELHTNRSAFTRDALKNALSVFYIKQLEQKQIDGYKSNPVKINEFSEFENEQAWIEE